MIIKHLGTRLYILTSQIRSAQGFYIFEFAEAETPRQVQTARWLGPRVSVKWC